MKTLSEELAALLDASRSIYVQQGGEDAPFRALVTRADGTEAVVVADSADELLDELAGSRSASRQRKACTGCGRSRSLTAFYPSSAARDGRVARCQRCERQRAKANNKRRRQAQTQKVEVA